MDLHQKIPFFISYCNGYTINTVTGNGSIALPKTKANGLQSVKLFGGIEQRNLPAGYTELEYIEAANESQYIKTNVIPDSTTEIDSVFRTGNNKTFTVLSRWTNSPTADTFGVIVSSTSSNIVSYFGRYSEGLYQNDVNLRLNANQDVEYKLGQSSVQINTHTYSITRQNLGFENTLPLWIFKGNFLSEPNNVDPTGSRVYSLKIKTQGVLVFNGVPAKNASDVVGLYDKVSGQFLTNQGTGSFIAGSEVIPTPDYPMDIVSNNGVLKASYNEFDANAITNGYFYNADLEWVDNSAVYITDYMNTVKGKYTLVVSRVASQTATVNVRVNLFNANKEIQSQVVIPITPETTEFAYEVDIPEGIYYVRTSTNPSMVVVSSFSNSKTIYTDGTVETINIHGKNLFDKLDNAQYINAYVNSNTGVLTEYSAGHCFCVPCKPNTTYTLSGMTGDSTWGSFTSNSIGTIATVRTVGNSLLTTGANDKYLIGIAYTTTSTPVDYRNSLQVEQGSTTTTYEPYYDGGTATAEMLLKLGNYRDVQSIIDGVVTRNVGILVLDGTESWTAQDANYPYFRVDFSQDFSESTYLKGGKCTHFKDRYITPTTNQQGFYLNKDSVTQKTFIALRFDSLFPATSENVNNLKIWLADQYAAGTPVIIVYPLKTPTTESVVGQTLQVQKGNNILEITQASIDNLALEATYKKSR